MPVTAPLHRAVQVTSSRRRALGRALSGPGRERDILLQVLKAAAAAVLAWQVAVLLLHSEQPFLAPLAALITVHATVYRSVRGAAQLVVAVLAGVLLAFLAARTLGLEWYSLAGVLTVALFLGRWHRLGDSGLQVPITALLAMTAGGGTQDSALEGRVVETLIGAVIGAGVNLLVMPPVHLRDGRQSIASIAGGVARLMHAVATGLRDDWDRDAARDWLDRARRLDGYVRDARETVDRGRESLRLNPRAPADRVPVDTAAMSLAVDSLEHVAVQCRSIASTLLDTRSAADERRPSGDFLLRYADVLDNMGDAFDALADERTGDSELEGVRGAVRLGGDGWRDLRELIADQQVHLTGSLPAYGSLLTDAERVLDELERAESALAVSTP